MPAAVINLSLACNHCADPLCLKGCPSNAYHKDHATGAIIIDDSKCLGCRYCQWNCPYDAPKFDIENRVIGKCNLCYGSLSEGIGPACSRACPTGALRYGEMNNPDESHWPDWFPEPGISPSIEFPSRVNPVPLKIIPEGRFTNSERKQEQGNNSLPEWSLVIFSFLVTAAASVMCSSLLKGEYPSPFLVLPLLAVSGIASLFHLGRPLRAWRSVANFRHSPLSREIVLFLLFSAISASAIITRLPSLLAAASVSGLIALVAIDNVYMLRTVKTSSVIFHSGQSLLTGLLLISYMSQNIIPFIFIASIKITFSVLNPRLTRKLVIPGIIRIAFLLIVMAGWVSGFVGQDIIMLILLLIGELIDRSLFYIDFEPASIRQYIFNYK
jgi:Fe-S-cluster-containing dehydrogenase component/DMSO reductase anchor subunit